MSGELFEGVKQWEFEWRGHQARLPVFYFDTTSMTAIFTASTRRARTLLPHADMHPVEVVPGRCLVAITAFEHRETDIGPYCEVSIAFLISYGQRPVPGVTAAWQAARRRYSAFVWQLPVTTEIARVGGVEMYGYPKFLADITFARQADTLTCRLAERDEHILTLRSRMLPTRPGKRTRYATYSVMDGIVLKANVLMDPIAYAETTDRSAAELEIGTEHAIAEGLRGLQLSKRPVMTQYSPHNQSILFGGRNLMDE